MKLYHERERKYPSYPRHSCNSELYAEISESPNSEPKVTYLINIFFYLTLLCWCVNQLVIYQRVIMCCDFLQYSLENI